MKSRGRSRARRASDTRAWPAQKNFPAPSATRRRARRARSRQARARTRRAGGGRGGRGAACCARVVHVADGRNSRRCRLVFWFVVAGGRHLEKKVPGWNGARPRRSKRVFFFLFAQQRSEARSGLKG